MELAAVQVDLDAAMAAGPVVLDGGLATELERRGHDVTGTLWSARLLRDDPRAIVDAHAAYLAAGARVITTASYQASFDGFAAAGVDGDRAAALMELSVELARTAIREAGLVGRAWVAASVGPYGVRGPTCWPARRSRRWPRPGRSRRSWRGSPSRGGSA